MNTFQLKETTNSRAVEVSFSDAAIANLSDVLSYVASNRLGKSKTMTRPDEADNSQLLLPGALDAADADPFVQEATRIAEINPSTQTHATGETEKMHEVFAQDGERLVLDNLRLKATGQLDASRRLVYLFLYAHELQGHHQVSRDAINAVLKDVGLHESNISHWISTSSDLRQFSEDGEAMFRLRKTGRDEAKRILSEVLNPDVEDAWTLSDRSRNRGKAGGEGGSAEKLGSNKGRKRATLADDWAAKWNALSLGVDGHSIVEAATGLDKGIFGLWAVRRATEDKVKVVSAKPLAAFLHKAFVVKVSHSTLQAALESKAAKGKVIRVKGGYEITPTGMDQAAALSGIKTQTLAAKRSTKSKV
jgi:hypothetical protein